MSRPVTSLLIHRRQAVDPAAPLAGKPQPQLTAPPGPHMHGARPQPPHAAETSGRLPAAAFVIADPSPDSAVRLRQKPQAQPHQIPALRRIQSQFPGFRQPLHRPLPVLTGALHSQQLPSRRQAVQVTAPGRKAHSLHAVLPIPKTLPGVQHQQVPRAVFIGS